MGLIHQEEMFDALADGNRRRLLVFLLDHESRDVPKLSGITAEMAEMNRALLREYLSGPRRVDGGDKELLRTHHVHLPKLDGFDFIEWDREAHVVTKGPRFDDMRPLIEPLEDRGERVAPVAEVRLRR
ncbi:DUF7344 domain-containing protein [Halopelagius longus]|uniref:DUF7344 domain-containing protein n=1 Tax=Halopelagius longus TaxID=1236180 RepID=A0A1H1EWR1_9EURY|nr:hypothetical protein [Halopelagius longus]RDI71921.1 hypothetical protein DWB78_09410 [Halopelagius longus]SDQ93120.1 hypothetical protein SAMN05216278_3100 [Halopelagius longus]